MIFIRKNVSGIERKERGKIKRSVITHFSDLSNGFKRVFNFTLIDLNTYFDFCFSKLKIRKTPNVN